MGGKPIASLGERDLSLLATWLVFEETARWPDDEPAKDPAKVHRLAEDVASFMRRLADLAPALREPNRTPTHATLAPDGVFAPWLERAIYAVGACFREAEAVLAEDGDRFVPGPTDSFRVDRAAAGRIWLTPNQGKPVTLKVTEGLDHLVEPGDLIGGTLLQAPDGRHVLQRIVRFEPHPPTA